MTDRPAAAPWIDEVEWSPTGPPWHAMGLARIDEADWLLPDEHRSAQLAIRRSLVASRRDAVVATVGDVAPASAEVLDAVLAWERVHRPDLAEVPVDDEEPLVAAGLRVQEDLVVMVPRGGRYHLDAAIVCFPSHWRLGDKVGGSAADVHGPVPGYEAELAERVDRFLDRIRPGVLVARRNWSVHGSDELYAPVPPASPPPIEVDRVPLALWLRSERQTLRRLPESGAVLFTIRVQQAPFAAFEHHRAAASRLAARLEVQPREITEMNGLAPHREAVLRWLASLAR